MDTTCEIKAESFAKKHGIKLSIKGIEYKKHFLDDETKRSVFKFKLTRKGKSYTFEYGQSIMKKNSSPTMYDVLSCLQKYDVGTFEDFCGNFGYDEDSRKAEKTYKAVKKEFKAMERLFTPEILEEMQEIE